MKSLWFKHRIYIVALIGVLSATILTFFSKPVLFVELKSEHADAVVVLGGDSGDRPFRALEALKSGNASYIVVTGIGDCYLIRDRLVLAGVPKEKVFVEENARNTKENAEFSVKVLQEHGCKKVILVTSWFHARRALACFQHFGHGIEFFSMPSYHGVNMEHKPYLAETPYVLHEYMGLAWYYVRYGIGL